MGWLRSFAPALILFVLIVAPALSAEPEAKDSSAQPTVDQLVRYFDEIVFQSEIESVQPSTIIKKWTTPLRVAFRAFEEATVDVDGRKVVRLNRVKMRAPHVRFIKQHLTTLVRIAKLDTEDAVKTGEKPNFYINFVPRAHMGNPNLVNADPKLLKRLASEGGCFFVVWADNDTGVIDRAAIVVNSERLLLRINHCLLEEMIQSLGLPNDSNLINPSIFSDRSRRTSLTRTDRILLKTLYDPRMAAGTPREAALKLARTIIAELDATEP